MSGHAYFGENLNKIRHTYVYDDGEYKKLRKAFLYTNGEFKQVWSGASEVSYYDGDTLMGVEEVDEGEDVLHPSFSTTKQGYTLVAWKDALYGDPLTELNATGEPMKVYALYLPNTLDVALGRMYYDPAYGQYSPYLVFTSDLWDSEYVSGKQVSDASIWYREGQFDKTVSFKLDKKFYQTATITLKNMSRDGNSWGRLDSNREIPENSSRSWTIDSGTHSIYSWGYNNAPNSWEYSYTGITKLTLSNPTPWT